jgi:hypothetical protein
VWELLKLSALELIPISMAEIVESSSGSFTGPCVESLLGHVIKVIVVLLPAAILLVRSTDHYCH